MNHQSLAEAISEAERFLKAAKECCDAHKAQTEWFFGSKETGKAKRASMDLTRALAAMRKPL